MALRKPIVLNSGQLEQLQSEDILTPVPNSLTVINEQIDPILIGGSVYISSANSIKYAKADLIGTKDVIGICIEDIAPSGSGTIQVDGLLTLTTEQWDLATGDMGGLTPGATYFLSDVTAGRITKVPPGVDEHYVVKIGVAISTINFEILIGTPIKL